MKTCGPMFGLLKSWDEKLYPLGNTLVNAALLADALEIVPDAQVVVPLAYLMNPLKPVFLTGAFAEVVLMPVLFKLEDVARRLEPLVAYQADTGEYGKSLLLKTSAEK